MNKKLLFQLTFSIKVKILVSHAHGRLLLHLITNISVLYVHVATMDLYVYLIYNL